MAKRAFTEGLLPTLWNHYGAIQGLWVRWVAPIRMWLVQTVANDCLDLSSGLGPFLSLTEDTALLSVCIWKL